MNKRTVALIALFAGWILPAHIADATTYKDIAGQWCGDVTDYVFTPNTLTVKFHDGRPANMFTDKESVTVFAEFVGNPTTMAQQQNGDKPRRSFHRC